MAALTRITLNMHNERVEETQQVAREMETSRTQVINNAVALYAFMHEQRKKGATLMIRDRWGNYREVNWS